MKKSPNNAKRQRQNETTYLLSNVQIIESDTEEDIDNISHGRDNLNSLKYIGSLRHQHDMSNLGIDFVLYQVMLTVGEMVHKVEQHKKKRKSKFGRKPLIQKRRRTIKLELNSRKLQQTFNTRKSAR